ncbi:MAG: alpha/beta hydrolase [Acidimicrobiia bacterium]|nr:alpha/beta hydrolase [Acidimicrobiia bacterium]
MGKPSLPHEPRVDDVVSLPDGRDLGYAEFGAPDGLPVLWFHGTPGSRTQLPPATHPTAVERGIRIIGVDRPGFGRSTRRWGRDLRSWPADIEYLADSLGLDTFAVVGLSGGGPYVLACAHDLPHRVSIGVSLGGLAPILGPEVPPGLPRLMREGGRIVPIVGYPLGVFLTVVAKALEPYVYGAIGAYQRVCPESDRPVFDLPGFRDMFAASILHGIENGLHGIAEDMAVFTQPWGFDVRDITVPIRFWHGSDDGIVSVAQGEWLASRVPDAELRVQEGEGHFAGFVCVEEVLEVIHTTMTGTDAETRDAAGDA